MPESRKPGYYTVAPDGTSPDYVHVTSEGTEEIAQCEDGLMAYQIGDGIVSCQPPTMS